MNKPRFIGFIYAGHEIPDYMVENFMNAIVASTGCDKDSVTVVVYSDTEIAQIVAKNTAVKVIDTAEVEIVQKELSSAGEHLIRDLIGSMQNGMLDSDVEIAIPAGNIQFIIQKAPYATKQLLREIETNVDYYRDAILRIAPPRMIDALIKHQVLYGTKKSKKQG